MFQSFSHGDKQGRKETARVALLGWRFLHQCLPSVVLLPWFLTADACPTIAFVSTRERHTEKAVKQETQKAHEGAQSQAIGCELYRTANMKNDSSCYKLKRSYKPKGR